MDENDVEVAELMVDYEPPMTITDIDKEIIDYVNKPTKKSEKFVNELEKELVTSLKDKSKELLNSLDQYKNSELDKIK